MDFLNFWKDYRFLGAGSYLTSLACLFLSFLIARASRHKKNKNVCLLNLGIGIWSFFYGSMFFIGNNWLGVVIGQLISTSTVFFSLSLSNFVLTELNLKQKYYFFWRVNCWTSALIFLLIWIPKLIITGNPPMASLPAFIKGGPLFFIIPLQLFTNFFFNAFIIWKAQQKATRSRKKQLQLFFISLLIGYSMGSPGYLPVFGIQIVPITVPFVIFYPIITAYAIMKYQFLDIQKLLKNTLIFICLFLGMLGALALILFLVKETASKQMGISDALSQGIAIAFAMSLYGPLKRGLTRLTQRFLFQQKHNPEVIFSKLSEDILHFLESESLASEITLRVSETLALDRIALYSRDKNAANTYALKSYEGSAQAPLLSDEKIIHFFTPTQTALYPEKGQAAENQEALQALTKLGFVGAFGVFLHDTLHTILLVGKKKSDVEWQTKEFKVLESFSRHLALSLNNAEKADAIRRSRKTLARSERDASAGALIAGIDHEVKNPLHTMSLSLSALKEMFQNPRIQTVPLEKIKHRTQQAMAGILEDIQTVNGIIQHLSDMAERKQLNIRDGVHPAHIAMRVQTDLMRFKKGAEARVIIAIDPSLSFTSDENILYEIFSNLVRNAMQASTEDGRIELTGEIDHNEIVFEVKDHGVGMSPEVKARIFEPFFTTKPKDAHEIERGTGMGLFIVKEYIQVLGGKIEVHSALGQGTTFTLRFPNLNATLKDTAA